MARERNIEKIEGIPLFYDGTRSTDLPSAIGNDAGMDVDYMSRMRKVFRNLQSVGMQFTKLYHLGGDFSGSAPWHSNGVALDIQGFELNGQKFIMDPGSNTNSYKTRPEVWLRLDAALRKEFTFVLGYAYPEHHNHFHPQPGGSPPGQVIYDPGRKGASATFFLQQALNLHLDGSLHGRLVVDGEFNAKTLEAWNVFLEGRGHNRITDWSRRAFLAVCDASIGEPIEVEVDGKAISNPGAMLVNGRLRLKLKPLADALKLKILSVDGITSKAVVRAGTTDHEIPVFLEGNFGHVFARDLADKDILDVTYDSVKRKATVRSKVGV